MLRPVSTRPAGESPVPVVAGEPGSRPRFLGETGGLSRALKASSEGASVWAVVPPGTSPAASSHSERGSRATYVTAKAIVYWRSGLPWSGPPRVWGAAVTQGLVRKWRHPSCQPCQQGPSVQASGDIRRRQAGKEGFDIIGCYFRARMPGTLWEQRRIIRYYPHRWPSARSMKRARDRVKALAGRCQVGMESEDVIERPKICLRGWGKYFCTGNVSDKFVSLETYAAWLLKRLLIKKCDRRLRGGQADRWTRSWFHDQGLHKLMGTIRYPKAA